MLKIILLVLVLSCSILYSVGQGVVVRGSITDSSEKKNLVNTVISVMRKGDSVLVGFTRSDKEGNFILKKIPAGKSILMVTHPAYGDYMDEIDINTGTPLDLGKIFMIQKSQLLKEYIVSTASAIKVKGDTTEYKADSFHLKEGATVEDLLKKLPGIRVDKNGKITAQGQAVQKVLVDGEEFFSDDPTIVTQGMLSDAIDKVQVYDKKSDQAAFTGVDDGVKNKTIDLKLKENRKKGYFGKVALESDGNKYWNNNTMLNAFKKKRKIAVFGIMSNTGKTGLDWNERDNYGSSSNIGEAFTDELGNTYYSYSGDDFSNGSYYGEGLPKGWNTGALYSNKWDNDKITMNTGYQYKKINNEARGLTQSKYILPDTLYYINDNGNSYNSKIRNTINGTYEYQIDSSSSLKIIAQGYTGKSISANSSYSESLDALGKFVNTSNRRTSSDADNKSVKTSLLYKKKFKTPGRTISFNVTQNYLETQSDGFLNADYKYYDGSGLVKKTETTDQEKLRDHVNSNIIAKVVYTEPLSKRAILEFNYGINSTHDRAGVTTLEKIPFTGTKYENVIDSLSNDYGLNVFTNQAGINYRYAKGKKLSFSFGGNISRANFLRKDIKTDTSLAYNFTNFFPKASLRAILNNGASIGISYSGSTAAPSVEQIQPVKDNSDLLNQTIGNPDLKQSFNQRVYASYDIYKLLSQTSLYIALNYHTVSNDFSTINFVDKLGRRISQPVNVQGNNGFDVYGYLAKTFTTPAISLGLDFDVSRDHNTNFINTLKNINNAWSFSLAPRISYSKEKKYDFAYSPSITLVNTTSSIRPDEPTKYITQQHTLEANLFLPLKIEFGTDCTFSIRQRTDAFDRNNNVIKWNAHIDKKIFKKGGAKIRLNAVDILNQNIGFDRNVNSNFISERTYDTFRRYFTAAIIWNFNKNGVPQE